jgi:PD-(D/E)XK nuclease superfamily
MSAKPQLHVSALTMQCGEAFRRRYIEKEIIPPGVASVVGTATDKTVTKNLENKITLDELLSIEEIEDTARDGLDQAWAWGVTLDEEERQKGIKKVKGEATDKAIRLSVLHAKDKAPELRPTHVQRKWALELPGFPVDLVGTLDIQEGSESVRDTKTSGKSPKEDVADNSIQLTSYALGIKVIDGQAPRKVVLDYLIDTRIPIARTYEATRSADDYQALLRRIETICLAIERGVFMPVSPDYWMCCPKWCGYFSTCRYVRRPKQFSIGE